MLRHGSAQVRIVLLIGNGTRVPAILECVEGTLGAEVVYVLSCKGEGIGTEAAFSRGIGAGVLRLKDFSKAKNSREKFSRATVRILKASKADFIVMAGWNILMPPSFVREFKGRIINIHPSILPSYPGDGKKAIRAQWETRFDRDAPLSGCTLHCVDEGMDTGEIIMRGIVYPRDYRTLEEFEKAIHAEEDEVLCRGIKNIVAKRRE